MNNDTNNLEPGAEEVRVPAATNKKKVHKYATPLGDMIAKVKSEPQLKFIYSGIKEKSVGIIFGPSKSGKTMCCENLGMCIAAGLPEYLGMPIDADNKVVLIISFEEHYTNRTDRNMKQVEVIEATHGAEWLENYIVVNDALPRYITTDDHWNELADLIKTIQPGIVFLDSLTHMYTGSIEDSKVAVELTKRLRLLSEFTDTTIVAIHHTHKMYGQPLSIDTIAGSRVLAQELDFMIGVNRTLDGKMYLKDVAFRYAACYSDKVRTFTIDEHCWINIDGDADEITLLSAMDGRKDEVNRLLIVDFLQEQKEAGSNLIPLKHMADRFVVTKEMSKQTLHNNLHKLEQQGVITKPEKGQYSMAA